MRYKAAGDAANHGSDTVRSVESRNVHVTEVGEPRELLIVGAGGFSREAAEAVRAAQAQGAPLRLVGFVDDDESLTGTHIDGIPVVGGVGHIRSRDDVFVLVGVGRPDAYTTRLKIVEALALAPDRYATIVHPDASLSASTVLGPGTVVLANVVATTTVRVGAHVSLMPGIVLTHDNVIDDYATLAAGVKLGGGVHVGKGAYIGAGVVVRENVRIGAWAMVGMGSVVTRDIPAGELWLGSPARYHRSAPVSASLLEKVK